MRIEWLIIYKNLNPLQTKVHCTKFGLNWSSSSGEEFFNCANVFSLFRYYLPLERDRGLQLNKFESHLRKYALYQVWLKLADWFWRKYNRIDKSVQQLLGAKSRLLKQMFDFNRVRSTNVRYTHIYFCSRLSTAYP